MTNYVNRLLYIDEAHKLPINALVWPFLLCSLVYGLGFVLFGDFSGVTASSLFQAMHAIHTWLPSVWGVAALASVLLSVALILWRLDHLGDAAGMLGVLVWTFAAFIYIINGYWLVLFSVTAPNLYFWVFYFWRLSWYKRQKRAGLLVDAH